MKRSLGKSSMSSLELLLDTICNMFGSIILITLLIVITTTENPLDQLAVDSGPDKEEIAHRIHTASLQIQSLQSQIESEKQKRAAVSSHQNEISVLQKQISAKESEIDKALQTQIKNLERSSPRLGESLKQCRQELQRIDADITDLSNQLANENRRQPELEAEVAKLESTQKGMVASKTENVRLPKTKETSKKPFFVFCMHGSIYPLRSIDARGNFEIFSGVEVRKLTSKSTQFIPQVGQGLSDNVDEIRNAFQYLPRDFYLACYVFPNSVEAFRRLRKALVGIPIEIGWDPEIEETLVFTTDEGAPAPRPQ